MKKLSYNTDLANLTLNVGYGVAGYNIIESLKTLGYDVPFSDTTAPVEIFFCQPEYWEFSSPDQYKIGYWPWESTKADESWKFSIDLADELWTTSEWCRAVYEKEFQRPVRVYRHGIDHQWTAVKRNPGHVVRFLHIGEPAPRKGGQMALNAFRDAFGDATDVRLVIKAQEFNTTRLYDRYGSIISGPGDLNNVTLITADLTEQQMIGLYHANHVLVYPSYGEGFGLIPLQGLATGMPTICTAEWAPYANYLDDLALPGRHIESPWPKMHPGEMIEPDYDALVQAFIDTKNNIDDYTQSFYDQAAAVHAEYDWLKLTEEAFDHLSEKFL